MSFGAFLGPFWVNLGAILGPFLKSIELSLRRSHSLESVLNPATHTADPLDHRTSWLLGRVLGALGYSHLAPERREQVRVLYGYRVTMEFRD